MEEIIKKIEKRLKDDASFKAAVDKSIAVEKDKRKGKDSANKSNLVSSDSDTNNTTFSLKHRVAYASSTEENNLYRCWILDSGSNIYVVDHNEGFVYT